MLCPYSRVELPEPKKMNDSRRQLCDPISSLRRNNSQRQSNIDCCIVGDLLEPEATRLTRIGR